MQTEVNTEQEANERLTYMSDLQKLTNKLDKEGYTDQFKVENGKLLCLTNNREYKPEDVKAVNFYRFEGPSDPDDMSICYVIETEDGCKGTLIDAYGVYADNAIGEFMQSVEIFKKTLRTFSDDTDNDPNDSNKMLPKEVLNKAQDPGSIEDPLKKQWEKS